MERQNVTLSLPLSLVKKARHLAVERGTSLSGLLSEMLEQLVTDESTRVRAERRISKRLEQGLDLGTRGELTSTRDELHER
jgi:hypothetical protein